MKYKFQDLIFDIEYQNNGDKYSFTIDDNKLKYEIKKISKNEYKLSSENNSFNIHTFMYRDDAYINIAGEVYKVTELDEDNIDFISEMKSQGVEEIVSPMPGSVVKVLVKEGDNVTSGDGLIIVEAMKMESTLYSTISGKVTKVGTKDGEQVSADDILIIVENEEK